MKRANFFPVVLLFLLFIPHAHGDVPVFNILEYGAVPDGKSLSTEFIQDAIDDCSSKGGGKVIIPPGTYQTGPLFLKSNIHVEIMAGAVLLADTLIENYPAVDGRWEGIERKVYASMFTGHHLENVSITGQGVLDGQGEVWWKAHYVNREMRRKAGINEREPANPPGSPLKYPRPRMINLYHCKNVLLRDLNFLNSPAWTIHPVYCENVMIENISINQPYESPNTDGINPESCNNVRISNCFVDCGDDCITIKSGYNEDGRRVNIPCENIVISNCTFAHGRSAIGIGSETSGGIRNVAISNCVFKNTYRGLRIKTARGRGNVVENIRATNIVMENVGTAISLDMYYGSGDDMPREVDETTPHVRNITYSQISGINIKKAGEIWGLPEAPITEVKLSDVDLEAETGLDIKFAKDFNMQDVEIDVQKGPSFRIVSSSEIDLDHVGSDALIGDYPVIIMEKVKEAMLRDCYAPKNTEIFLETRGTDKDVRIMSDQLKETHRLIIDKIE